MITKTTRTATVYTEFVTAERDRIKGTVVNDPRFGPEFYLMATAARAVPMVDTVVSLSVVDAIRLREALTAFIDENGA